MFSLPDANISCDLETNAPKKKFCQNFSDPSRMFALFQSVYTLRDIKILITLQYSVHNAILKVAKISA